MPLKENLLKRIEIKKMAQKVIGSLKPQEDGYHRIDKNTMRRMIELTPYTHRRERDLDLYIKNTDDEKQRILVLDNGLAIFEADLGDVVLRKSPTVKEIISLKNIFKILNDSDVVVSKKEASVEIIMNESFRSLDLSFNEEDLDKLIQDGESSLENQYPEGVIECMMLFAELLDYAPAPGIMRLKHHVIYGKHEHKTGNLTLFGPMIIYSRVNNELKLMNTRINTADKTKIGNIRRSIEGESEADARGTDVFDFLKSEALGLKK